MLEWSTEREKEREREICEEVGEYSRMREDLLYICACVVHTNRRIGRVKNWFICVTTSTATTPKTPVDSQETQWCTTEKKYTRNIGTRARGDIMHSTRRERERDRVHVIDGCVHE